MKDLSPESFDKVAEDIKNKQEVAQTYHYQRHGALGKKIELDESNNEIR